MARPSREDGKDTRSGAWMNVSALSHRRHLVGALAIGGQEKPGLAESARRDESIEPWHRI